MGRKDWYIYDKLKRLFEAPCEGLSLEEINKYVAEYEKENDIQFEPEQKMCMKLINNTIGAIVGCPGCGKTTIAKCLIYLHNKVYKTDGDIEGMYYLAPTGRAADRLKESIRKPTRTLHSFLCLDGDEIKPLSEDDVNQVDAKVIIIDESSMISTNLMYSLLLRMITGTKLYFLGDIDQLPSIGFGRAFADILGYIPTYCLGVCKRAAKDSLITENSTLIRTSNAYSNPPLKNGEDFRILNIDEKNVADLVCNICSHHLYGSDVDSYVPLDMKGNVKPKDLQVMSPIKGRDWGSVYLNKRLQDYFNPRTSNSSFVVHKRELEFRVNDKIIHLKNSTSMPHFELVDDTYCQTQCTGIMNGSLGRIIDIRMATDMDVEFREDCSEDFVARMHDMNTIVVIGEYKDYSVYDSDAKMLILYPVDISDMYSKEINIKESSLKEIDLAYALTVHKLQGSQSKIVIGVVCSMGGSDFLSRNMVHTLVSRASGYEYLVGDISGENSAVSRARKIDQNKIRKTYQSIIE